MVGQREEQLLGPQVRKELVKEEKQEAGQRSWRAESGNVVGDSNGGGNQVLGGLVTLPVFLLLQSALPLSLKASQQNKPVRFHEATFFPLNVRGGSE